MRFICSILFILFILAMTTNTNTDTAYCIFCDSSLSCAKITLQSADDIPEIVKVIIHA